MSDPEKIAIMIVDSAEHMVISGQYLGDVPTLARNMVSNHTELVRKAVTFELERRSEAGFPERSEDKP